MASTMTSTATSTTPTSPSATGGHIPLPHTVSYAKSSRSQCKGCHKVIEARQLRMGVTSLSPFFDGTVVKYYHVPCYFKRKRTPGVDTSKLDGFKGIQYADQDNLRKLFGEPTVYDSSNATKDFASLVGKLNNHSLSPIEENFLDWQLREKLEDLCGIPLVKELLLLNRQPTYGGEDDVLRRCAQGLLYGAVDKCPKCSKGNLHYNELENNWSCSEFASAWGKCPFSIDGFRSAPRRPFAVQYTSNKFLLEWCRLRGEPTPKAKSDILQGLKIVLAGRVGRTKIEMEEFLERHSAELHAKIVPGSTTHVISSDNVVYKGSPATDLATKHNVPIVYEEFLDECINAGKIVQFDRFVIIRGKPKSFSDNGELIVLDASGGLRSSYGGDSSSTQSSMASGGSEKASGRQSVAHNGVKSTSATFVPSNIQLLGFDEDDYMVDNSTPLDYSASLSDFNTHLGLFSSSTFDSLVAEPQLTESQLQDSNSFDLVQSYQSAMIGFEARQAPATPPSTASREHERASDSKARRWSTLPGQDYSSIAKKYVEAETKLAATHHIYESRDETGKVTLYDVTLNQTELSSGRNAYYRIQLLAPDAPTSKRFFIFFRWGRVGTDSGSSKLQPAASLESALREFEKKFYDKTSNRWKESLAGGFIKCGGKMFPLEMEYEDDVDTSNDGSSIPSQLLPEVQELVKLIFDPSTLQRALEAMKIDVEKMPLGKISKAMILEGYRALRRIDDVLKSELDVAERNHQLADLAGRFYTIVPHSFGRDKPPVIDSAKLLSEKLEMLQTLTEIEIASALIKESKRSSDNVNPLDRNYSRLKTTIAPIDMSSPMAKLVIQYANNSRAHSEVGDIVIEQIYAIEREGEKAKAAKYDFLANRQFLWHGSRLSNFAGILSQGLRIAPPEAPVSGYMFGKGVYLADMFAKSASYCHLHESNGSGLMLLCETILGDTLELAQGKFIERSYLDSIGKNSTKGLGKVAPTPKAAVYLDHSHRATAPLGAIEPTGAFNCELDHNEYIVYDTAQVIQGFLLRIRVA